MHTLKAVSVKFFYYAIGILPMLFIFLGKENPVYAFAATSYAFVANHFIRKELKNRFPIFERNLSTYIAIGLFVLTVAFLFFLVVSK